LEVPLAAAAQDQYGDEPATPLPLPSLTGEEQDKVQVDAEANEVE
jgi:hypothetical protein